MPFCIYCDYEYIAGAVYCTYCNQAVNYSFTQETLIMPKCPYCKESPEVIQGQTICPNGCDLTGFWQTYRLEYHKKSEDSFDIFSTDNNTAQQENVKIEPINSQIPPIEIPAVVSQSLLVSQSSEKPSVGSITNNSSIIETKPSIRPNLICKCGDLLNDGAEFCDQCGESIYLKCAHCGNENRPTAKFCKKCGRPLNKKQEVAKVSSEYTNLSPTVSFSSQSPQFSAPKLLSSKNQETAPLASIIRNPASVVPISPPSLLPPFSISSFQSTNSLQQQENSSVKKKLQLVVLDSQGNAIQYFSLKEGDNMVGAASPGENIFPDIDLVPFDLGKKISRRHALIKLENGKIMIMDHPLKPSTNGTKVNGKKITQSPVEITEQVEILFANISCRIVS